MTYALVQDGKIVSTYIPEVGVLPDGSQVSGFDKLEPEILAEAGWLPIEDSGPPEVTENQVTDRAVILQNDKPVAVYTVIDIPPEPPQEATIVEQLDSLISLLVTKGTLTQAQVATIKTPKPVSPGKPA